MNKRIAAEVALVLGHFALTFVTLCLLYDLFSCIENIILSPLRIVTAYVVWSAIFTALCLLVCFALTLFEKDSPIQSQIIFRLIITFFALSAFAIHMIGGDSNHSPFQYVEDIGAYLFTEWLWLNFIIGCAPLLSIITGVYWLLRLKLMKPKIT